jgi:hypothetical protein
MKIGLILVIILLCSGCDWFSKEPELTAGKIDNKLNNRFVDQNDYEQITDVSKKELDQEEDFNNKLSIDGVIAQLDLIDGKGEIGNRAMARIMLADQSGVIIASVLVMQNTVLTDRTKKTVSVNEMQINDVIQVQYSHEIQAMMPMLVMADSIEKL